MRMPKKPGLAPAEGNKSRKVHPQLPGSKGCGCTNGQKDLIEDRKARGRVRKHISLQNHTNSIKPPFQKKKGIVNRDLRSRASCATHLCDFLCAALRCLRFASVGAEPGLRFTSVGAKRMSTGHSAPSTGRHAPPEAHSSMRALNPC